MGRFPNSHQPTSDTSSSEPSRRRLHGDDGATLVEGAIVAPVIILLLFSLLELSLLLQTHLAVRYAIDDATREISLSSDVTSVDDVAMATLQKRTDAMVSADIENVVIYQPDAIVDGPSAGCRGGSSSATCQTYGAADVASGVANCTGSFCPDTRDDDSLIGIWIKVRHNSITGIFPDQTITAKHVQRVSPAAG